MRGIELAERALDARAFDPDLFPARLVHGAEESRMFLVTGSNAAGKSLLRRVVQVLCREDKQEFIGLSMESRSGSSFMDGFAQTMVYGDETYNATGLLSSHLVTKGIETCRSRDKGHVVFWDEPDIGLSDELSATMGVLLAGFAEDMPELTGAAFVATHSRHLARRLADASPQWIHLGPGKHKDIESWSRRRVMPADLEKAREDARKRMRFVFSLTKEK